MRSLTSVLLVALAVMPAVAQQVRPESLEQGFVIVVEDRAKLSSAESPIYIGANQVNWTPNHPTMKLSPRSDGKWQIHLVKPSGAGPLEFKFTRGSWETVEVAPDLSDVVNRRLDAIDASAMKPGEPPRFEFVVERWADQRPDAQARKAVDSYRTLKVTGDVRRLQVVGGGGRSLIRDALVWLPPGYDTPENAGRRYPVLYLQDGQNVFEQLPGVPGEWRADETATALIEAGRIEPLIIVAIPHSGPFRMAEYLTVPYGDVQPAGEAYARWLATKVVPRVDAAFRTRTEPEHRAIGGSSLGAHVARHAAASYPEVFGKLLAESPAMNEGASAAKGWPARVYVAGGGRERASEAGAAANGRYLEEVRRIAGEYEAQLGKQNVRLVIEGQAPHNEQAWAARLPAALEFLFPADGK